MDRPEVISTVRAIRSRTTALRRGGGRVGLVPTLGALHDGHVSLVRRAVAADDHVVVSIFVNPLQFGPGEDLDRYPRDLDADLDLLAPLGVAAVFAPGEVFATGGHRTTVRVSGLTAGWEGARRPGHFDGVTTIVAKLLHAVGPDRVYFGDKDYQQLTVVKAMVADLDLPVEVVTCPTVRDADGLALSSRNRYLSAEQRAQARALHQALRAAADTWDGDADRARDLLRDTLEQVPGVRLDYAEVVDPETLEPLEGYRPEAAQALVAAFVGPARLIDTIRLELPSGA